MNSRVAAPFSCTGMAGVLAFTAFCGAVPSLAIGYLLGAHGQLVTQGNRDADVLREILGENPKSFGRLTVERGPADKMGIHGIVSTQAELDALRAKLNIAFGQSRTEEILNLSLIDFSDVSARRSFVASTLDSQTQN